MGFSIGDQRRVELFVYLVLPLMLEAEVALVESQAQG